MLQKSILLLVCFCAIASKIFAQNEVKNEWRISAGAYTPNLIFDGIKIGVEQNFRTTEKVKQKQDSVEKTMLKKAYYGFNLGYYYLPFTSNNIFLEVTIGKRRIGEKNFIHGGEFGFMFINSFNYGTTFTVDDENNVDEVILASNRYLAPKISYEFGYLIIDQIAISLKLGAFCQTMHFKSFVPQVASELCVSYKLTK